MKIDSQDIPEGLKPFTRQEFFYPKLDDQKVIYCSISEIVGTFAHWAIQLSPYAYPDNLEKICRHLDERLVKALRPDTGNEFRIVEIGPMGIHTDSAASTLVRMLHNILRDIPEYHEWNNRKNGRDGNSYSSRYGNLDENLNLIPGYDPDDNFVDLGALERTVATSLVQRYILESRDGYVMTPTGPVKLEVEQPITKAELSFTETLEGATVGVVKMDDGTSAIFIGFPNETKAIAAQAKLVDLMITVASDEEPETAH